MRWSIRMTCINLAAGTSALRSPSAGVGGQPWLDPSWQRISVGIRVFATGGIGGVHRGSAWDISADLLQLAQTPVLVVCSGAKSILDLPATLEFLETHSVPVVGYQTDEFPAFFSASSGLRVSARVDDPEQAAQVARLHWELGNRSAVLVCVPVPQEDALASEWIETIIQQALDDADEQLV